MVTIQVTGIQELVSRLRSKLLTITEKDAVTKIVATTMAGVVRDRIHEKGQNADGQQIGNYSDLYLRTREKNNRGRNPRVIISLTRELENDFALSITNPIKTDGGWGIGFIRNPNRSEKGTFTHSDISEYMEWIYEAKIWDLTKNERKQVIDIAQGETNRILNSK